MKQTFLIAFVLIGGAFAQALKAQGTLSFSNFGVNSAGQSWSAPIYNTDGVTPLDSSFEVELYISSGVANLGNPIYDRESLASGSTTQIAGSGLFSGPTLTFSGSPGSTVYVVVAAWPTANGSTWAQAYAGFGPTGYSSPFAVTLGSATSPGSLAGMPSFTVQYPLPVPESGSLSLCTFGAIVLAWAVKPLQNRA